ncbi:MAG: hypothetical protein VX293_01985 [Candidatus Latescibacterota bacterium]|nr:hypothetical protein [Candidatus Latescibacterota bacterium]
MSPTQTPDLRLPWAPRLLLAGRSFRLPVQTPGPEPKVHIAPFQLVDRRFSARDNAFMYYLRAPRESGNYPLSAQCNGQHAEVVVKVRTLDQLRQNEHYNGVDWPRRWPLARVWDSTKTAQTLQDAPLRKVDRDALGWWLDQDDETLWRQLPAAEWPRAHYVNVHQGCPNCGTALFAHHGFYPWVRNLHPADLRSTCPACGAVFPSNDLRAGDYSSGAFLDDGFGYFDDDGHLFLFAAAYHRDLVNLYTGPIDQLTALLRQDFDPEIARRLGMMLLRYAVETINLAAVPQFRHGPSQEVETAWDWGQPDWGSHPDPVKALFRKGMLRYAIDVPIVGATLALAYDTLWPFLKEDRELVARAQALGLAIARPQDAVHLVEEMLAALLQCLLDGGGLSNLPRVSEGALTLIRGLDRADAQDALEWLYDRGPEKLRGFGINDFFPCGTPPEATGGYNDTHTRGLFALEYQLRQLRQRHPRAYPESRFPSLLDPTRARRIVQAPGEIALLGRIPFHFGDGGSSGVQTPLHDRAPLEPLPAATRALADEYLSDAHLVDADREKPLGNTVLDGVGIAILRTGEVPERAAAGIVYGDAPYHRHMDLLDVQLYAYDRPFLSDLGYPQSWASVHYWEGHWATHNSVWSVAPDLHPLELPFDTPQPFLKAIAGRGRLVRILTTEGLQVAEVEAERWAWNPAEQRWYRPGIYFRRLIALVETDGQGTALVDLARVAGGTEHWRLCRGLEGEFVLQGIESEDLPGTAAGPSVERGQLDRLAHPDHAALAYMDQPARLKTTGAWRGTWTSCHDPAAELDLHALRAPAGAQTARATAAMGAPDQSRYTYRTLLWRRETEETSCFDLVFEPRLGPATLSCAEAIPASDPEAIGVRLETCAGRELTLYWHPQTQEPTHYADGTELSSGIAACIDGEWSTTGAASVQTHTGRHRFARARQTATITALDRNASTLDVKGLSEIATGDRVRIQPAGRNYRVVAVAALAEGHRLTLDLSSVLGKARIAAVRESEVELDFFLPTRTGYLHETRLERERDGAWQPIVEAANPDMDRTLVELASPPQGWADGDWVRAVAYAAGDTVEFEPAK